MASLNVLTFDAEDRAIDFVVWLDDLQLFLQCDNKDGLSLFDLTSGASTAPTADADSTVRSQWLTRDAAARLAVRNHLPSTERAHFSQYKSARALYDVVVARYSSPTTAALSRLMLPYLFPDLAAFSTVTDLVAHLRTSDARYLAALPTEFLATNSPPMYITLYYLVTRFPNSLSSVRDHFLSLCPTELTATVAPPSLRGVPLSPFSPLLPLLLLSTSLALRRSALRLPLVGDAALARAREARVVEGAVEEAVEDVEVVVGVVPGVGASVAAVEAVEAVAEAVEAAAAVLEVAEEVVLVAVPPRSMEALVAASVSSSCAPVRPRLFSSFVSGTLGVGGLGVHVPVRTFFAQALVVGRCVVSHTPRSASAAPGAGTSAPSGTAPTESFHTFTLDSGASRSFFRDSTTLTPLHRPVAVSLADPSGGAVLAHSSTVLPCPAAPSGLLSGLHLPSFSTNLVSGADLQDAWVDQFTPGGQRVTHCTCSRTGRHLATFTRRPGSSLYTLTTESPPVAESGQVAASSQVFAATSRSGPESAPCSCRLLSHQTLLWHNRLGHPSLPRLRGMASRVLVSGLPRSLPPLRPGPAPTCVPYVEGRQRAAPHSSEFHPTEAPLQTLHMDVWGPARVRGQGHERYFLLVVDVYSRYTTVFPLRSKGDVIERRGVSSARLGAFCRAQGIRQTFTLPDSPQQNGIAERRIGMVMDVARTSMIPAAAPHFLWPFVVQYAAHQLNLQPRVSLPETSPTLRWTEKVGDASAFRVWGSRVFVRDLSADKLSPRAVPCVFLGFPPDAPGWQFYHPTSRRVLSSKDVTFDESVPYYRLFPYRTAPLPPPPLFLAPGPPPVDPLPPKGPALSGSEPEGAEPGGAESGGAEPGGAEPRGAGSGGAEPGGTEPGGAGSTRVASRGTSSRRELLSPQELREWFARRWSRAAGAGGTTVAAGSGGPRPGGTGAAGDSGAAEAAGVGPAGGTAGATGGTGAAGPAGSGAAGANGAGAAGGVGAGGSAGTGASACAEVGAVGALGASALVLQLGVLGLPPTPGPAPPLACLQPVQSQSQLQPASPLPAPSPYTGPTGGLAERHEPESRPASPVRAARTSRRAPRPPAVPGTHQMALHPSTAPLRVPLPSPPESSLPVLADPESDSLCATSPTVTRLLATIVTDPSFESTAASALVAELVDFAARCRLDYATSLVAESASCFAAALPHLVSTLTAPEGDPDAPNIPTPRSYAEAIEGPYSSQWQSAMDAEMASWKSTGTYVDEVPPPGASIVTGMWIFRVKRPPGSPPAFKARYVERGFSQRQGVDFFQTFSPTPKMTTLRLLLHVAAQRDYELHSLDFSTAFLQGSLHDEIWLRRPPGFTRSFPAGTQCSLMPLLCLLLVQPYGLHSACCPCACMHVCMEW
ncbi:unnamed protein product [Closterium sp. NIES-53]